MLALCQNVFYICIINKKLIEMKTVTRCEVRWGGLSFVTDNICAAWDMYDILAKRGTFSTIHEITTTERDITDNARVRTNEINNIINDASNL